MNMPATTRVPLPPLPEDGLIEPVVSTGELVLVIVAGVLTIALASIIITFFVRQQRRESRDG
ncbi:MAG: hypothetical protein MK101_08865 [Phycisphaerales bacterium]|nr:hypothetical protein [Phycisphaerales bacterium]